MDPLIEHHGVEPAAAGVNEDLGAWGERRGGVQSLGFRVEGLGFRV